MLIHLLAVLGLSASICMALVVTRPIHIAVTGDHRGRGQHKTHEGTIPRVGGIAVFLGAVFGLALASPYLYPSAASTLWILLAAASIIFCIGLLEDLTHAVLPWLRYAACLFGAFIFSTANNLFGITSAGFPPIDALLTIPFASAIFFIFAVAGVTNAFNLIDGQNGLCAGYTVMVLMALGIAAGLNGQATNAVLCEIMIAANLGFLVFNFPIGRIFLGDSGAYLNGAVVAIISVMIVEASSTASPWFAVLVLIYPITETVFTMARRVRSGHRFYSADCYHLHHVLARFAASKGWRIAKYPAIMPLALAAPSLFLAPFVMNSGPALIAGASAYAIAYFLAYTRLRRKGLESTEGQLAPSIK